MHYFVEFFLVYEVTGNYYKHIRKKSVMRTFVAIDITNQETIQRITKVQSEILINAKPVGSNNLHFTLQFLGEISEEVSHSVIDVLSKIEFDSFEVNFNKIGVFPNPKFPRVVWIGIDDKGEIKLRKLAKKVHDILEPLGFNSDKSFKPHITIFRIKNKVGNITNELEKLKMNDFGSQEINSIKFKQSKLTPSGPIYTDLKEVRSK